MLIFLAAFVTVLAGVLAALLVVSPGTPVPFLDSAGRLLPGSLSEKSHLELNGTRQGMFIKSRDVSNPVLLSLHGGMPDVFLTQEHPTGLDDLFTVVWWEQRGSGMSSSGIPPETVTVEQLISDTVAMTRYLCARFGKQKIFVMGHSGGTFVGLQVMQRHPELYEAYIGVAQVTAQLESERLASSSMIELFRARGDTRMVQKLEAAPITATAVPPEYLALRDEAMHTLGVGTMHDMRSVLTGLFLPSLRFREYTLAEKWRLWRAKSRAGVSVVWNEMIATDLRQTITSVEVPVFFLHGEHDLTVNYALAKDFLEQLEAPVKGFYSFASSAHSPLFEEPAAMNRILRDDVLRGRNQLADVHRLSGAAAGPARASDGSR